MSKATITIAGNVGKDPELKTTTSGQSLVAFSVGVNDGFGDRKTTTWYNVSGWDKLVESVPKFVKKGALVLVTGAFKLREYTDNASGQKRYSPEITAFSVERLDTRSEGEKSSAAPAPAASRAVSRPAAKPVSRPSLDDTGITDDDIPF
jgi:single-strand DNA-binding protein